MGNEPGLAYQNGAMPQAESQRPYYQAVGNEETVFKAAYRQGLSLVLKGPTGCGKTRFVEAMAHDLGRPLITVACHDDLTTADLVGRYLLKGDETIWVDGPLTRAVREGAICYLDEVVEARQDTTVVLHPLADYRRQLPIERLGVTLDAGPEFGLVVSYKSSAVKTAADLFTKELIVGGSGATDGNVMFPTAMNKVLGTKFKVIPGYGSTNTVAMAMEQKEIEGAGDELVRRFAHGVVVQYVSYWNRDTGAPKRVGSSSG